MSSVRAASAAEAAATREDEKYIEISRVHLFYPIAFEIMGPSTKLVKISSQSWEFGFLHLLTTHVKPLSCSNVCPSFHLHTHHHHHLGLLSTYKIDRRTQTIAHLPKHTEAHHRV